MKILILLGLFILPAQVSYAEYLRTRDMIGKSSFTSVATNHVSLSSAPSFVRTITFSGVEPTTVTIFDTQLLVPNISTKTIVYYPGGVSGPPVTVFVDVINGSGTMINKVGLGHVSYSWDWYTRPVYANPLNERN